MVNQQDDLTPEEHLRRLIGLAPGMMESNAPPRVEAPNALSSTPSAPAAPSVAPGPIATPAASGAVPVIPKPQKSAEQQRAETELGRLQTTGSGVEQLQHHHPILGTIARIGDVALQSLFPRVAMNIPGTTAHHQTLEATEEAKIGQGVEEQQKEAAAQKDVADATKDLNPAAKQGLTPEEVTIHDLMTGLNGTPRINPQTGKPYTYLEAFTAVNQAKQDVKPDKPEKPDTAEQQYLDAIQSGDHAKAERLLKVMRDTAAAKQPPARPEKEPKQLAVAPDGTVIELRPGVKVPAGTKTAAKYGEPSTDEQRRADLANNMEENLASLEEIVNRRPDLFGPMAGRVTQAKQFIGTSDPDVAKLKAIREYLGMASVGAHAMRNAQHVGTAADAVMAGFVNSPEATKEAIQTARRSIQTFKDDVAREKGEKPETAKPKDFGPAPAGKPEGATGKLRDGTKIVVQGGRLVAQ